VDVDALEGGHGATRDARDGRHARHAGQPVDEDRAAAALTLRGAAVLDVAPIEGAAQRVEERAVRGDGDLGAVEGEGDAGAGGGGLAQLNELPQPQVLVALGFVMWNPAPWRVSE
jgi:hypothetical protein